MKKNRPDDDADDASMLPAHASRDASSTTDFEDPTVTVDLGSYAPTVKAERQRAASQGGGLPHLGQRQLPARLGQYTLVELLALGGMAEVYLARHDGPEGFSRTLVIKRLHPHLVQDERFSQMFLREARLAAGLQHPNIVRIDELSEDQGITFIAMEFVDGLTLHRLARRAWRNGRSLPMELAVTAVADAALGLHYAHTFHAADGTPRHIVHRDVSPDNLIIDRHGVTRVLDFGVAKAAGSVSVTRAGEVKGKIPYMAPEQLHGQQLDGRADLYSLGATLYWLLTGRRPFTGKNDVEVMHKIAYEEPERPRALNPEIPEAIESIVLRLLAKEPEARFASGDELSEALQTLVPPSRKDLAAFVEEGIAMTGAEESGPISTGSFLAATPHTAHFVNVSRQLPLDGGASAPPPGFDDKTDAESPPLSLSDVAIDVVSDEGAAAEEAHHDVAQEAAPYAPTLVVTRPPRRKAAVAAALGGAAALFVGLGAFALMSPAPEPVTVLPQPASVALPEAPQEPQEPEEQPAEEPSAPVDDEEAAPPPTEPPPAAAEPSERPAARRAPAPAMTSVAAIAPTHVRWLLGRRKLGAGNATLEVPAGTPAIVALDTRRGVRTQVLLKGKQVRYADAPTGTLDVRAFPFAAVFAGSDKLGTTPFAPMKVAAGSYKLRLEHEGAEKRVSVDVKAGATAKVRVNMLE